MGLSLNVKKEEEAKPWLLILLSSEIVIRAKSCENMFEHCACAWMLLKFYVLIQLVRIKFIFLVSNVVIRCLITPKFSVVHLSCVCFNDFYY